MSVSLDYGKPTELSHLVCTYIHMYKESIITKSTYLPTYLTILEL